VSAPKANNSAMSNKDLIDLLRKAAKEETRLVLMLLLIAAAERIEEGSLAQQNV